MVIGVAIAKLIRRIWDRIFLKIMLKWLRQSDFRQVLTWKKENKKRQKLMMISGEDCFRVNVNAGIGVGMGMGTMGNILVFILGKERKVDTRLVSNEYLVSDIPWDAPKMSEESSEITEKGQRSLNKIQGASLTAGKDYQTWHQTFHFSYMLGYF
ncbi:hypothetical protein M0802_008865 [Mischocyttarus mexicanus]|nr:hypothetical protein M0802_008865 [Mischocyttarus mexicanus]